MTAPSKPPPSLMQWWPVIITLGGLLVHGVTARADVDELRRNVASIETRQKEHEVLPGHAESLARIRMLEADSLRHQQTTALILEKLAKIEANIAVLCQSVKGAQCVR